MSGYIPQDVLLNKTAQVVGASATDQVVSKEFRISANGAKFLVVDLVVSAITVSAGIDFELQTTAGVDHLGNEKWIATGKAAVALTAVGMKTLSFNNGLAADAAFLPLRPKARVVVTSGAGDTVTVANVFISQEQ